MSKIYYQPLKPGTWSKISHRALLQFSLINKNYETFIFSYICLHAHPLTNQAKFKGSLLHIINRLTGWSDKTIKRAISSLKKLKLLKTMTSRKPHYLVNAEAMNKQLYLPEGFQQGLQMPNNDIVERIMRDLPVYEVSKAASLTSMLESKDIDLAKKDLELEQLEESKEELIVWYDERIEAIQNDLAEMKMWIKSTITPDQEEKLPPKLRLVIDNDEVNS